MKPLTRRLEALLFTSSQPLAAPLLASALHCDEVSLGAALNELQEDYANSAMELVAVASGWRFQLRSQYRSEVQALAEAQPPRYSRAFWETLAYIAYNQPVTRGEIDRARGVQTSSNIYQQLFHLEWVEVVGRKKAPGSPELLAVTRNFLDDFALEHINQLPAVANVELGTL